MSGSSRPIRSQPRRASAMDLREHKFGGQRSVHQRPSLASFWLAETGPTPASKYLGKLASKVDGPHEDFYMRDLEAEKDMRQTLVRNSGDVWLENGHAFEGGSFITRTAEMFKPVPALRVLDNCPKSERPTLGKRQSGVVSTLAKKASRLFEKSLKNNYIGSKPSKYAKHYNTASLALFPNESRSTVTVIAPSPVGTIRGVSRKDFGGDTVAQVHQTTRCEVSHHSMTNNLPTFRQELREASNRCNDEGGDRLDGMDMNILPAPVSFIEVDSKSKDELESSFASTIRDERRDNDTLAALHHQPMSDYNECCNNSFEGVPSFHNFPFQDQSTPQKSLYRKRACNSPSSISSTDSFCSPRRINPESHNRHSSSSGCQASHLNHKASFGLPTVKKQDFTEEMRRSFDDITGQTSFNVNRHRRNNLPPVSSYVSQKTRGLSRVSERSEGHNATESFMTSSTPFFEGTDHSSRLTDFQSTRKTVHSRSQESEHGYEVTQTESFIGDVSLANTLNSIYDGVVAEMERMMETNSSTRTDFVISSSPSLHTDRDECLSHTGSASILNTSTTSAATSSFAARYTTSYVSDDFLGPFDPSSDQNLTHAVQSQLSRSHPRPITGPISDRIFDPGDGDGMSFVHEPHLPIQNLYSKRSTDTIHTPSDTAMPPPRTLFSRYSKQRLGIAKEMGKHNAEGQQNAKDLKQKQAALDKAIPQSPIGLSAKKEQSVEASRRAFKPLALVENRNNETSLPLVKSNVRVSKQKSFNIFQRNAGAKNPLKAKIGQGKENALPKGSKTSVDSSAGVGSVRGLRV
ncbi:uncharacterized protein L203_104087 [Cryptococcus depauperatus CBS 7841]|uniref:Uncharacterized protein n=1 Tax=Cryptococcus depauperatus CBS 7841 TaxID=1295531 RepID=A0A1E3IC11_9TREE|nr:hypothetical protein L203_04464 [Cryptococcus depauperatus CBS 7841]